MTKSYTEKPSWFYKPIQVDNLEEIQKELSAIIYKKIPNFESAIPAFKMVYRDEIEPFAPLYVGLLESLGILDKWVYSPIISTNYNVQFPIHIDNIDWIDGSYGLNLPVINCENTYTVWYDAEIDYTPVLQSSDPRNVSRLVKHGTPVKEIARWHMKDPAWINFSIPHAPVSYHGKARAVMSARFKPELHDLLYK